MVGWNSQNPVITGAGNVCNGNYLIHHPLSEVAIAMLKFAYEVPSHR